MKKTITILVTFLILWSLISASYALPEDKGMISSDYKEVDISTPASTYKVNVGECLNLSAVTPKHGSSYTDKWLGAECIKTSQDTTGDYYLSNAFFKADKPGNYVIEYNITMTSGKSNITFTGTATYTIEVTGKIEVVGAEIKDITLKEDVRTDGSIAGYFATGKAYIIWSNNTSSLYSTKFFYFKPNETSKDIAVTFNISGETYKYNVTIPFNQFQ